MNEPKSYMVTLGLSTVVEAVSTEQAVEMALVEAETLSADPAGHWPYITAELVSVEVI